MPDPIAATAIALALYKAGETVLGKALEKGLDAAGKPLEDAITKKCVFLPAERAQPLWQRRPLLDQ